MKFPRVIITCCLLFAFAAVCVVIRGRIGPLAIPAVISALLLPLIAHCRHYGEVVRLASSGHTEKWEQIKKEIGIRSFVYGRDDLGDPSIALEKQMLRRWGTMYAVTMIASIVFTATAAWALH